MVMSTSMLSLLVASTSVTSSCLAQKTAWPLHLLSPVLPQGSEHFPTAFQLPHPQLTGHCQLLCHHGSPLTTTAIQETPRKPSLVSQANLSKGEDANRIAEAEAWLSQTQTPQAIL